jgi:ATP-binding cassette subfamily B protein
MTPPALESCLWPAARLDELAAALARAAGLGRDVRRDPFELPYRELAPAPGAGARRRAPAALRAVGGDGTDGSLLALLGWTAAGARVLAPDGGVATLAAADVAAWLRAAHERAAGPGVDRLLARAEVPAARAAAARAALLGAGPEARAVAEGWWLRPVARSLPAALRQAGVLRRLWLAGLGYGAQLVLLVVAWWMVGARAVGSRAGGWGLGAWAGVLAALVAVRFAASWAAGRLAIDGGEALRARLLDGLLGLDTEPLRAEGIGHLLGRVMETEAVEALALGGGMLALAAAFELGTGIVVLALGAAGPRHIAILSLWLAVGAWLAARLGRSLGRWAGMRLALTHDLVERMVGHRTLVAQQPPELRHRDEDQALDAYARAGRAYDRDVAALAVIAPRGWLLAGVAAIAPALGLGAAAGGGHAGAGAVAASLGGVLFVYGALRKLGLALPALMAAAVAWHQASPLFRSTFESAAPPQPAAPRAGLAVPDPLVAARDVGFRYPGRARPALVGCSLDIRRGDRVLLEGPSGGGKSTLAALLAGLRAPDVGTLELDGVEQPALGLQRWRARVGAVPQFHENHVFSASLLFNLIVGRGWPPRRADVAEAEAVLRELDLGGLLARMPSGLEQLVGEGGWQLSHGERSRIFIARALLQRLDARILDESFAALDPETLERALACVLRRADTLVVIAHP